MNLKDIIKLDAPFWKQLGEFLSNKIRLDASEGKFQNDRSGFRYSPQYAKYKANGMRRVTFTNRGRSVKGSRLKKANGRFTQGNKRTGGTRGSISSTNVAFVNMELTGQTLRGLRYRESTQNSVTIGYNPNDGMKILGNKNKHGYDILGLSTENQALTRDMISDEIKENIKGLKDINLTLTIKV